MTVLQIQALVTVSASAFLYIIGAMFGKRFNDKTRSRFYIIARATIILYPLISFVLASFISMPGIIRFGLLPLAGLFAGLARKQKGKE